MNRYTLFQILYTIFLICASVLLYPGHLFWSGYLAAVAALSVMGLVRSMITEN